MERCPVINCNKSFQNKYSLTNHLKRTASIDHKEYYEKNVKKRNCTICGRGIDRRSEHQDICYTCLRMGVVKKEVVKEFREAVCFKCGTPVSGYFSRRNTRVLCETCMATKVSRKKEYDKDFDAKRYSLSKQKKKVNRDSEYKELCDRLELLLKKDLVEGIKPIHKICKEYNTSLKYIKVVAKRVLTDQEYKKRNFICRQRAGIIEGEKHKERWRKRKRPKSIIFSKKPNKLEELLGEQVQDLIKDNKVRYNVWKTLREVGKDTYLHLQSDLVIKIKDFRVCILCDGEAFHGPDCYFRVNTVEDDEYKSMLLFVYNPFVLRYSETEIKKGYAIEHFKEVITKIESGELKKLYRSWMRGDEKNYTQKNFQKI